MNLVSVDNISKIQGNKKLFENISFGVDENQKIALIGVNGCGKTTLLKIIYGTEKIDNGIISKNKETRISFLEQIPVFNPDDTIIEHIFDSKHSLVALIKKYEELCAKMGTNISEKEERELQSVMEEMDKNNAWEYEHKIKSVLAELEIEDLFLKMENLSGGMLKKVSLAQCLISDANLLIMDEPTNHLDLKTIKFLQDFLTNTEKAIIIVTHDRYFLDEVCNTIIEIDRKSITRFEGNYSFYLEKKSEIENNLMREDDRVENILRKELEWYKRQPKARTTKSKSRMDSIDDMIKHEKFSKAGDVEISISGKRLGKKILEVTDIEKSFGGRRLIKPFTYLFKQNEKIGIIGPNGSGKTTFLNILTGKINPDSGIVDKGINTVFGYFTQNKEEFDPEMRIIDYVKKTADFITLNDGKVVTAAKMLERFLFPSSSHYNTIGNLSGGEKRRLYLLNILMANPNFLILDEPTNDLDIKTLSILENFLNDFEGCLIVVTHDRYFMNRVVDSLLVFDESGIIKGFPGNYSDFILYEENQKTEKKEIKEVKEQYQKEDSEKKKLSFKEKKELEEIEKEIEKLESEKKDLDIKFSSGEYDSDKLKNWTIRYEMIEKILTEKISRWEYLANIES
jgi:ABC transport system ATP-binding/permease protein